MAIVIVALAALGWQQGDGGDGGGPLNAVAAAAERTRDEPGGRAAIHAVISLPEESKSFTMSGRGVFDADGRSQMTMTFRPPGSDELAEIEAISDGVAVYMRSDFFGSLPDDAEWMLLDLSFLQESEAPLPTDGDAMGELELLETVADDVQKLGEEDVRGVPTTLYRGSIDVSERAEQLREDGADKLAAEIEGNRPLQVEAWIDADGLVRRMRYVQAEQGEGATSIDMRVDFFDFGTEPVIDLPDSGEVFDATGIAKEGAGLPSEE